VPYFRRVSGWWDGGSCWSEGRIGPHQCPSPFICQAALSLASPAQTKRSKKVGQKKLQKTPLQGFVTEKIDFGCFKTTQRLDDTTTSQAKKENNLPVRNPAVIFLPPESTETRCVLPGAAAQPGAWSQPSLTHHGILTSAFRTPFQGCTMLALMPGKGNLSMPGCRAPPELNRTCPALLLLTGDIISTLLLWIIFQFCGQ